jgi:hypothetical protein
VTEGPITDEELTALALAADPDAPIDPDATPFGVGDDHDGAGPDLLPAWYAPGGILPPSRGRARRRIAAVVILALLAVNAAGLCVTYGVPEIAW